MVKSPGKPRSAPLGETEVWAESELRNNLWFPGQYFDSETGYYGLWSMDPVWGFIYDATGGHHLTKVQ